jgi:hypothetical protein
MSEISNMYISLHPKYPLFLSDCNESWTFSTVSTNIQNIKSHENLSSESRVFPCRGLEEAEGWFTHSMPRPCRSPAMPCRYGYRMCLSHLIYTVRPCLIHTCHAAPMPCSDHAVLLKATAQHGRRETTCGLPARVRLLQATTRSSTKIIIRSIPNLLTTIHTYDCKEWYQHTPKRRSVKLLD